MFSDCHSRVIKCACRTILRWCRRQEGPKAGLLEQSQCVLLGQDSEVDVHYMCAPGSCDDIIWRLVQGKLQVVGETLDGHLAGTATGADGHCTCHVILSLAIFYADIFPTG